METRVRYGEDILNAISLNANSRDISLLWPMGFASLRASAVLQAGFGKSHPLARDFEQQAQ
jgi:hypothetical protein